MSLKSSISSPYINSYPVTVLLKCSLAWVSSGLVTVGIPDMTTQVAPLSERPIAKSTHKSALPEMDLAEVFFHAREAFVADGARVLVRLQAQ